MALSDITTTGWILALLKRDDGQTLLLGSGAYDFKESQQHFAPNTYANDVVELQGTDGQLLTGQVRRSTAQSFDGFVGEAGMTRADVEQYRRQFLMFFRRGHKYTVIYIFPDGTAIKRDRGYIVDAPSVPELYQILPEFHVALAFEDVNYYSYAEDSSGNETFAFSAHLNLSDVQGGGLEWDANGAISDALVVIQGKNLYNEATAEVGMLLSDGTINPAKTDYLTSDYIPITGGDYYTASASTLPDTDYMLRICWYKSDKTFISPRVMAQYTNTAQAPANAAFARFEYKTPATEVQFEHGNAKTAYVPYTPGSMSGGYQWASASGGGPTFITVTGIDDAQPVWKVVGPATNPTLTNSTSGVSITWNGTVPSNQTLIVDMGAQTATLEGANVFAFISGSWLTLEPGTNRIAYTAANTTNGCNIYWNEIVG